MSVRVIPAGDDYRVTILGSVVEVWCESKEAGFMMFASELEPFIDALLLAYFETVLLAYIGTGQFVAAVEG